MIHSNSFMYFRYLKCVYTWYWMPQKPCINGYYFCVVKMEELFAIAVSFGKIVRNRGFSLSYLHPKRVCCRQRSSSPEDSRWLRVALKRELKSEKREPETVPFFGPRVFVTTRDPFLRGLSFCLRFSPAQNLFNFSGRKSRILILRINLSERKRVKRERRRRIDKKTNFLLFRLDWNWNWIDFERTLHLGKTVWLFTASLS